MKIATRISRRVFTLPAIIYSNIFLRPRLKDNLVQNRFAKINTQYAKVLSRFDSIKELDRSSDGYSWDSWTGKIRDAFKNGVSTNFLANRLISFTMVFGGRSLDIDSTKKRISSCREILGDATTKQLLLEDYVGLPIISDAKFMTSANRAHHSCHLAYFYKLTGKQIWHVNTIIEWGGGYGSMARIIRRMNPNLTYIIVDLPELLSLEYVYLGSIEGVDKINIITSNKDHVITGSINLISSELLLTEQIQINCDAFISTWALTECPKYIQKFVHGKYFFSAKDVFIASCIDENNHLRKLANQNIINRVAVPDLNGNNEYWSIKQ